MPDAMVAGSALKQRAAGETRQVDVAVVGAGFAGLYLLHRLPQSRPDDRCIGRGRRRRWHLVLEPISRRTLRHSDYRLQLHLRPGTGERVEAGQRNMLTQPEILRYLGFVADRDELRRDIRFRTKVTAANWDQVTERRQLATDNGAAVTCPDYIMATDVSPPQAAGDPVA